MRRQMLDRNWFAAIARVMGLFALPAGAQVIDFGKYPDWKGQWARAPVPGVTVLQIWTAVGPSQARGARAASPTKGGVASAWMLHEMKSRGMAPLAFIFNSVNPILVQGAALGDLPMLAGFDDDITAAIPNGAELEVDPKPGLVAVLG